MVINNDVLISNGFETNHPEYVLKKYYKHGIEDNCEFRIMVDQEYIYGTNKLTYNVNTWKCNTTGSIVKRASLSNVEDTESLNSIISLCNIDYKLS